VDALAQRQAGFEASTGDIVIFQHDDHVFDQLCIPYPTSETQSWDVLSPQRYTLMRSPEPELLNNGYYDGYVLGHGAIYRRTVIERCPWKDVPRVYQWDIAHTQQIIAAGFTLAWTTASQLRDVELGGRPWE